MKIKSWLAPWASLAAVLSLLLAPTAAQPPRRDLDISVETAGVGSESADITWRVVGDDDSSVQLVLISATYVGPCSGVRLPPTVVSLNASQSVGERFTITQLQEFSSYQINVTLQLEDGAAGSSITVLATKGSEPEYQTVLRVSSRTRTTLTISWRLIPCLDLNSQLEQYYPSLAPFDPAQNHTRSTVALDESAMSHTFTGLLPASLYSISLNASFTISDAINIQNISIAAPINASTFSIPGPHSLIVASIQATRVTLSWQQEEPTTDLSRYVIRLRSVGPCDVTQNVPREETIPITMPFHVYENLMEFSDYEVSLTAFSTTNEMAEATVEFHTLPIAPSAPPTSVRAINVEQFSATVTWAEVPCEGRNSEISGYVVYYAPTATYGTAASRLNVTTTPATNTTVAIAPLMASTLYSFQVEAVNAQGLTGPPSALNTFSTPNTPPPPNNLQVISSTATSALLSWNQSAEALTYTIVTHYSAPCPNIQLPPLVMTVRGTRANITGLQEFSTYVATVTPRNGLDPSNVSISTLAGDPTPADDHVRLISASNTTIGLQAPPIACIDRNGIISEFRLRYAETADFLEGVNIRNGLFTPGLVIVGNLLPGTSYTFQLRILTMEGGSITLPPLTAMTGGTAPTEATPTTTPTTPTTTQLSSTLGSPGGGGGLGATNDAIITTVVLVVGICVIMIATVVVLVFFMQWRRSHGVQKSDRRELIEREGRKMNRRVKRSDLVGLEPSPFQRQPSVSNSDETSSGSVRGWAGISTLADMDFSKMDWMSGLGATNPTSDLYQDEEEFNENVFDIMT